MERLERMLHAHPDPASDAGDEALTLVRSAAECALVCATCADACLSEENVAAMRECIRLNLDCSDICATTARLITRAGHSDRKTLEGVLRACATACRGCADECERHAGTMEHCRICAEACRRCAEACDRMAGALVS